MNYKLIYILNHYSKNGAEHFEHILDLILELARQGVETTVVIEKGNDTPVVVHEKVHVIKQKRTHSLLRIAELFVIYFKLKKNGYNHCFIRISNCAGVIATIASKLFGGKVFFWKSGMTLEHEREKPFNLQKIKWYLQTYLPLCFIKTFCYRFVTGPERMGKYYIDSLKVKPNKIAILYNDINLKRFYSCKNIDERHALRKKLSLPLDKTIIFFAHHFSPVRKNLLYFPAIISESFAANKSNVLCLAGEGKEKAQAIRLLKENTSLDDNQLMILGNIPNKIIADYYRACDIFINPSHCEGFPRVILEAMASGCPIVTTDAGGIIDILNEPQKEYMISRNEPLKFSEKLDQLISSPKTQKLLAQSNVISAQNFSTEKIALMYKRVLFET